MAKQIYVLDASPYKSVFGTDLAKIYAQEAREAGHTVRLVHLRSLSFDPVLKNGYKSIQELEPDLIEQQQNLEWCDHWVIVTPVWWESVPAKLKGLFDRILLPGFAFNMHMDRFIPGWEKRLSGRSARVIYTQTIPQWYSYWVRKDSFYQGLKHGVLAFVGFHPIQRTVFNVQNIDDTKKESYFSTVRRLGREGV